MGANVPKVSTEVRDCEDAEWRRKRCKDKFYLSYYNFKKSNLEFINFVGVLEEKRVVQEETAVIRK